MTERRIECEVGILRGLLTAERERDMRREHARMHPDGLMRSGKVCDICLLLAALRETHGRIPRCSTNTARGYRCAKSSGHHGPHSHPNDGQYQGTSWSQEWQERGKDHP